MGGVLFQSLRPDNQEPLGCKKEGPAKRMSSGREASRCWRNQAQSTGLSETKVHA
jgi:hypothetical protein